MKSPSKTLLLEHSSQAALLLRDGLLVGVPTETVYGLAARADRLESVLSIFEAKQRPHFDPLILHIPPTWNLDTLVERGWVLEPSSLHIGSVHRLIGRFWPGPLTLLFRRGPLVLDEVTSGSDWVAVRQPSHAAFAHLLSILDMPLAAPSANRFGRVSPTDAQAVLDELSGSIAAVLDGGPCEFGVESTIIAPRDDGEWTLLRRGAVAQELLEHMLQKPLSTPNLEEILAPGMLKSHYAPHTPLRCFEWNDVPREGQVPARIRTAGVLGESLQALEVHSKTLSGTGDDREAAKNLFRTLREMDAQGLAWIAIELPPEGRSPGLWPAIRDRLLRAEFRKM